MNGPQIVCAGCGTPITGMGPLCSECAGVVGYVEALPAGRTFASPQQMLDDVMEALKPPELRKWYACPTCGCTEIQYQAWVDFHTDEVQDPTGGDNWCPQCDREFGCCVEVAAPKPYHEETV